MAQTALTEAERQKIDEIMNLKLHALTETFSKMEAKIDRKFAEMLETMRLWKKNQVSNPSHVSIDDLIAVLQKKWYTPEPGKESSEGRVAKKVTTPSVEVVAMVGYPQCGDNTKGVVSWDESIQKMQGTINLMSVQIDASADPGNSDVKAEMSVSNLVNNFDNSCTQGVRQNALEKLLVHFPPPKPPDAHSNVVKYGSSVVPYETDVLPSAKREEMRHDIDHEELLGATNSCYEDTTSKLNKNVAVGNGALSSFDSLHSIEEGVEGAHGSIEISEPKELEVTAPEEISQPEMGQMQVSVFQLVTMKECFPLAKLYTASHPCTNTHLSISRPPSIWQQRSCGTEVGLPPPKPPDDQHAWKRVTAGSAGCFIAQSCAAIADLGEFCSDFMINYNTDVSTNPQKVRDVDTCPTTSTLNPLGGFLEFTDCYIHFVRIYEVFAIDNILSTIMCSPWSIYSWDILVQRVGNKLFFDKRDVSQLDLLVVHATSQEPLSEAKDGMNSAYSLSIVVAYINQNFSQQLLLRDGNSVSLDVWIMIDNVGISYPYASYFHEVDANLLSGLIKDNIEGTTKVTQPPDLSKYELTKCYSKHADASMDLAKAMKTSKEEDIEKYHQNNEAEAPNEEEVQCAFLCKANKGNVGLIFTKGDLTEVSEAVAKYKVLNITTTVKKSTFEIITPVELIKRGDNVQLSNAPLLPKLGIRSFSYGLVGLSVYDSGYVFSPEVLDDDLIEKFGVGVTMVTALSLAISYPTLLLLLHICSSMLTETFLPLLLQLSTVSLKLIKLRSISSGVTKTVKRTLRTRFSGEEWFVIGIPSCACT